MNEKLLLETVVLAGEIMLVSGAEVYRVEDTMKHMLDRYGYDPTEMIVLATGIFATLNNHEKEPLTLVKRTPDRSTNINRIYLVNDISRRFCEGAISVEEAHGELLRASRLIQYGKWLRALGIVGICACFAPIFGGSLLDFFVSGIVGIFLAAADWGVKKIRLNDFCVNAFCAAVVALSAFALKNMAFPTASVDVLIISAIMPLVPGVTFTTAIRDTLNGDYSAGMARILEAVVIALAVAAGVGCGMILFQTMGGGRIW